MNLNDIAKVVDNLRKVPIDVRNKNDRQKTTDQLEAFISQCSSCIHDRTYNRGEVIAGLLVGTALLIDRYGLSPREIATKMEKLLS